MHFVMETSTVATSSHHSTSRLPPSSPSLVALLELVLPSPILSSSDISTSLTSEEIPVLLLVPSHSRESVYSLQQQFPPLKPNPRNNEFASSGFSDKCDLYGALSDNYTERLELNSGVVPSKSSHDECLSHNQGMVQHSGVQSGFEEGCISRCSFPSLKECTNISVTRNGRDLISSQACVYGVDIDDSDEISPINYQVEQASSSKSESVRSLSQKPQAPHASCTFSGNNTTHKWKEPQEKVSRMTQYPQEMPHPQFNLQPHDDATKYLYRSTPSSFANGVHHSTSGPFCLHSTPSAYGPRDEEHEWLQHNTTITLLIDQEGFRTAEPMLKLTKGRRRKLWDLGGMVESELVIFKPVKRETFRFHYAPFDGLPILRRLTINDDDTRDYLSRQANLRLRSSGTYAVHGSETPTTISGFDTPSKLRDDMKLFWQFDYSIEDHRTEYTDRFMDGEKVLVPLAFSCSPQLLHPSQGKKITVMHIVKKTIATKLSAELLVKSSLSSSFTAPSGSTAGWTATGITLMMKNDILLDPTNVNGLISHRRAHSNPRETPELTPIQQTPSLADNKIISSRKVRPRRASSAGESHFIKPRMSPLRPPSDRALGIDYIV